MSHPLYMPIFTSFKKEQTTPIIKVWPSIIQKTTTCYPIKS